MRILAVIFLFSAFFISRSIDQIPHFRQPAQVQNSTGAYEYQSDINRDGDYDFTQKYSGQGILQEQSQDLNFDGLIDTTTVWNKDGFTRKISLKNNGVADRQENGIKRGNSYLVTVEQLENNSWVYKHSYRKNLIQADNEVGNNLTCDSSTLSVMTQSQNALTKISELKPTDFTRGPTGFLKSSHGFLVDESCLNSYEMKYLNETLHETLSEGVQCLNRIGKNQLVDKNIILISNLLENSKNPPKLLCKVPGCFGGDLAYGTLPGMAGHPFIFLNPKFKDRYLNPMYMKGTIFHELMHNIGYSHQDGIDYASTCDECCFPNHSEGKNHEAACQICSGAFKSPGEHGYLDALIEWADGNKDFSSNGQTISRAIATRAILNQIAAFKYEEQDIMRILLKLNNTAELAPFARALLLASLFESDHPYDTDLIIKIKKTPGNNKQEPKFTALAEGIYQYFKGNLFDAAESLNQFPRGEMFARNSYWNGIRSTLAQLIYDDIEGKTESPRTSPEERKRLLKIMPQFKTYQMLDYSESLGSSGSCN